MSDSNDTSEKFLVNSPNYNLARELGYELSKEDYSDMLNYAKLVQKEYSKVRETSPRLRKHARTDNQTCSSKSSLTIGNRREIYFEDLWIKTLREYFESELNG